MHVLIRLRLRRHLVHAVFTLLVAFAGGRLRSGLSVAGHQLHLPTEDPLMRSALRSRLRTGALRLRPTALEVLT
jgi:hypothetical protein